MPEPLGRAIDGIDGIDVGIAHAYHPQRDHRAHARERAHVAIVRRHLACCNAWRTA